MVEIYFYLSLFLIVYVYLGYPLMAACLGSIVHRDVRKKAIELEVTIIIAAFNEESSIAETIANKLQLNYPHDKFEIIVVSDGSTDRTDAIVRGFADRRVRLIRQECRAGKTSALNMAVPLATGEVIIFSDANSLYAPDAIRQLLANFADEEVGYVSGRMIYANPDGTPIGDGCSAYMKYENALRAIETRLGSIVGVDGGIDAVRKPLYRPMKADQLPDFVLPLQVVAQGYRVVYEPQALLWESTLNKAADEYRMRVRVSLRAFWALFDMRSLLAPWQNPLFAWQIWSHKVLRYLCFFFMVVGYFTNILLLGKGWSYLALFVLQSLCYLLALTAPLLGGILGGGRLSAFARYFFLINLAAGHAFWKFLKGEKQVIWTPRKG
jgi:cellulose synthase/poly-beta-1,6-N-acetylglucosamine synthase-like glycosyltransferase